MYEIGFSDDDWFCPGGHLCEYLKKDNKIVYRTPVGQILSTLLGIRVREKLSLLLADLSNDIDLRFKKMVIDYVELYQNKESICHESSLLYYLFYEYAPNAFDCVNRPHWCLNRNVEYGNINNHIPDFYESISIVDGVCYYPVKTVAECCILTLLYVVNNNYTFNKCHNCGDYFIPVNRSNEMYCDAPAIQDPTMTCKEYGSKVLWHKKRKDDPALSLYDSVYATKNNRRKRSVDTASHKAFTDNFERFKHESSDWIVRYQSGECTADEFIQWLNEQKGKKT